MIKEAYAHLQNAHAPYSGFSVASCICSDNGNLYTGVNIENQSYGLTICAERSAICQMVAAGDKKISAVVIMAGNNLLCPPCGACRQVIKEFANNNTKIYLCDNEKILRSCTMDELLPLAFNLTNG